MKTFAVVITAAALAVSSITLLAQTSQIQTFEVASVKETPPDTSGSPMAMVPRFMPPTNGRFSAANIPLRLLVRQAYEVQDFQIVGGPSWFLTKRFDIQAKAEDGFTGGPQEMMPLLRALLEDRFKLRTHREQREMPVGSLVIARSDGKLGPDLKPSTADCPNPMIAAQRMQEAMAKGGAAAVLQQMQNGGPCSVSPFIAAGPMSMGIRANGQPIAAIVSLLTQTTGRIVRDRTGLQGLYDFQLVFDPSAMLQMMSSQTGLTLPAGGQLPQSDAPSLQAAVQEQLGLKLVTEREPVDVLVVDSAELPTPD
jgi:uncharacterized protein (TIGR03435 family)